MTKKQSIPNNVNFTALLDEPFKKIRGLAALFHHINGDEDGLLDFASDETEGISMFLTDIAGNLLTAAGCLTEQQEKAPETKPITEESGA